MHDAFIIVCTDKKNDAHTMCKEPLMKDIKWNGRHLQSDWTLLFYGMSLKGERVAAGFFWYFTSAPYLP